LFACLLVCFLIDSLAKYSALSRQRDDSNQPSSLSSPSSPSSAPSPHIPHDPHKPFQNPATRQVLDATHFARAFEGLPLAGFYAGGEIGPLALAEVAEGAFQYGAAAMQGFTVVFGVFVKPKARQRAAPVFDNLDEVTSRSLFRVSGQTGDKHVMPAADVTDEKEQSSPPHDRAEDAGLPRVSTQTTNCNANISVHAASANENGINSTNASSSSPPADPARKKQRSL